MQRYILIRFLQSLLTLWVMSVIVFSLARFTGDPLDVLLAHGGGGGGAGTDGANTGGWISRCF